MWGVVCAARDHSYCLLSGTSGRVNFFVLCGEDLSLHVRRASVRSVALGMVVVGERV